MFLKELFQTPGVRITHIILFVNFKKVSSPLVGSDPPGSTESLSAILQRRSINSLLDQHEFFGTNVEGKTVSISYLNFAP